MACIEIIKETTSIFCLECSQLLTAQSQKKKPNLIFQINENKLE